MSDGFNSEECNCECHRVESIRHVMPCCYQCPICKKNIIPTAFRDHVKECERKRDELNSMIDEAIDTGC